MDVKEELYELWTNLIRDLKPKTYIVFQPTKLIIADIAEVHDRKDVLKGFIFYSNGEGKFKSYAEKDHQITLSKDEDGEMKVKFPYYSPRTFPLFALKTELYGKDEMKIYEAEDSPLGGDILDPRDFYPRHRKSRADFVSQHLNKSGQKRWAHYWDTMKEKVRDKEFYAGLKNESHKMVIAIIVPLDFALEKILPRLNSERFNLTNMLNPDSWARAVFKFQFGRISSSAFEDSGEHIYTSNNFHYGSYSSIAFSVIEDQGAFYLKNIGERNSQDVKIKRWEDMAFNGETYRFIYITGLLSDRETTAYLTGTN